MTEVFELFWTIMGALLAIGAVGIPFVAIFLLIITGCENLRDGVRQSNRKIVMRGIGKLVAIPVLVFGFSAAAVLIGAYPSEKAEVAECECAEETK